MRLVSDEESSMLKISNVQLGDRGNYTCIAKNSVSEARAVTTLNVQGKFLGNFGGWGSLAYDVHMY